MNIINRVLNELYFITTTVVDWMSIFLARIMSTLIWSL